MLRNLFIAVVMGALALAALCYFTLSSPSTLASKHGATAASGSGTGPDPATPPAVPELPIIAAVAEESAEVATELATITLGEGTGGLSGIVRDPSGQGVPGARVRLFRTRLSDYELEGGASLWEVIALDPRNFFQAGGRSSLQADGTYGRPVSPQFREDLTAQFRARAQLVSGEGGVFTFGELARGEYLVAADANGSLVSPAPRLVHLETANATIDVGLIAGHTLTGRVTDPNGGGVSQAQLALSVQLVGGGTGFGGGGGAFTRFDDLLLLLLNPRDFETTSASDGAYSFTGIPAFSYSMHAAALPWASVEKTVSIPDVAIFDVALEPGAMLSGVVLADGGPVVGAEVRLSDEELGRGMQRFLSAQPRALTDANGRFSFAGLRPGLFRLQASAAGFTPAQLESVETIAEVPQSVEVLLDPSDPITGRVTDRDGKPIAEVEVRAMPSNRRDSLLRNIGMAEGLMTSTDRRGEFTLDRLPAGDYTLNFSHAEYAPFALEYAASAGPVAVVLNAGNVVSGRVVDAVGEPIAGARVNARAADRGGRAGMRGFTARLDSAGATTTTDGLFTLRGLEAGDHRLSIRARGYAALQESIVAPGELGDLALEPALRLAGIVIGPRGEPLAGARVRATQEDARDDGGGRMRFLNRDENSSTRRAATGFSSDDGHFDLELPATSGNWNVTATLNGFIEGQVSGVAVNGVDVAGVKIQLSLGASITGRVLGADGLAIAGAEIALESGGGRTRGGGDRATTGRGEGFTTELADTAQQRRRRGSSTRSAEDGSYRLGGLESGKYSLRVNARSFAQRVVDPVELVYEVETYLDVNLERAKRLRGVVVDMQGQGIAGALVRARGPNSGSQASTTSAAGEFVIGQLANEAVDVSVSAEGFGDVQESGVLPEGESLVIQLPFAFDVVGTVIDSTTFAPIPRAVVRAELLSTLSDGADRGRAPRAATNGDGVFTHRALAIGVYRFTAEASGYASSVLEPVNVTASSAPTIEFALKAGPRLIGRVTDAAGKPIAEARVQARAKKTTDETTATPTPAARPVPGRRAEADPAGRREGRGQSGTSQADGSFEVTGLSEGEYEVEVRHAEYLTAVFESVAVAVRGSEREWQIQLDRGAEIDGTVFDRAGRRVAEGRIVVRALTGSERRNATVDAEGRYRVAGLAAGSYELRFLPTGTRTPTASVEVEVRERQAAHVDLHSSE
ncbi:MAG: carboxypeptidase regulatory-like domain-containing protein [Planctomycetota bacterium]